MRKAILVLSIAAAGFLGCGNSDASGSGAAASGSGAPASSGAAAKGSGAPASSGASTGAEAAGPGCKSVGCGDRKGDFFEKCDCKGKNMTPPITLKWTGKIDSFFKRPTFEAEDVFLLERR